jgi:hypothetical protein
MRKPLLGGVVALCAALGLTSVASAVDATQAIDITMKNTKAGTKDKPKSVGSLKVSTLTTLGPTAKPGDFWVNQATIFFDKNLVFNASAFKTCSTSDPVSIDAKCKNARVGAGSAKGQAQVGGPSNLNVKAYNGPKVGSGYKFYLHVSVEQGVNSPVAIDSVIKATLKKASGPYGWQLVVPIPEDLKHPALPTINATLTEFITTVSGTAKGKPYVGLKGCSGGKLKFKGTFAFSDNTTLTANDTAKCSK